MYYDKKITLIKEDNFTTDAEGNDIPTPTEYEAYCGEISINQSEFFSASLQKFKPEMAVEMHEEEYSGEQKAYFDDDKSKIYDIYRTFTKKNGKLELYLTRKTGGI